MRYHWGLGIGHMYSHGHRISSQTYPAPDALAESADAEEDIDEDPQDGHDGEAVLCAYDDDHELEDTEPEDQDVDVDSTGSQAGSIADDDSYSASGERDGDEDDRDDV